MKSEASSSFLDVKIIFIPFTFFSLQLLSSGCSLSLYPHLTSSYSICKPRQLNFTVFSPNLVPISVHCLFYRLLIYIFHS